jgi:hypothetical protein
MSRILRASRKGPVSMNISLIEEIEAAVMIDCEPGPSVIAPLFARAEALLEWNAPSDPTLDDDVRAALDEWGGVLMLEEVHAVQRLRGWHRTRSGSVTVDACWLAEVRNLLDSLTFSYEEECDQTLKDYGLDRVRPVDTLPDGPDGPEVRAEVLVYFRKYDSCGECNWCHVLRLRDQCDAILDAAGYYGGSRYEAYCKPRPVAA